MQTLEWNGERIAAPGCYAGIPIDFYHGTPTVGPSISSSGLRTIWAKSPAHYWCRSALNPDRVPDEPNDAFDLGSAAHHWLLGEDRFSESFVLSPYDDFRSKEARAWRDAVRDAGRTVLTAKQMSQIRGMRDGLMRNPLVREAGILDGLVERSLFWTDPDTGVWLRSRPDVIPTASGLFVDLKTTSVVRDDIAKTIGAYGYAMQAALLRIGCRALKIPFEQFSFVFVEKDPPHCARVVVLKDHELDRGEKCIRAALRIFVDCLASGVWPGPGGDQDDAEWIESPTWLQTATDNRLAEIEAMTPAREPAE
jgi:hypothetical protein